MIRQRPLKGGRDQVYISIDPKIFKKLLSDANRFDTSASFVGNTALGTFFGIELDEPYYKVNRNGKPNKRTRRHR